MAAPTVKRRPAGPLERVLSIFAGHWPQQRSIVARVVDLCGGCIPEVPHADLSKAAFSKLYDLDVGRVKGRECASHAEQLTLQHSSRGSWC